MNSKGMFLKWYLKRLKQQILLKSNLHLDRNTVFENIYRTNKWNNKESVSGPGSQREVADYLIQPIQNWLKRYQITSILDIPCGDFNWMQTVCLDEINYVGADIVSELVDLNNQLYQSDNCHFVKLDLVSDDLPTSDLILCRDCLVHLPETIVLQALKNCTNSGAKYIALTHFPHFPVNYTIKYGEWRPLNLTSKPYYLPEPLEAIDEYMPKDILKTFQKQLAIWKIEDLKALFETN